MDVCEPALQAVVVIGEAFMVEAHEVKNGSIEKLSLVPWLWPFFTLAPARKLRRRSVDGELRTLQGSDQRELAPIVRCTLLEKPERFSQKWANR